MMMQPRIHRAHHRHALNFILVNTSLPSARQPHQAGHVECISSALRRDDGALCRRRGSLGIYDTAHVANLASHRGRTSRSRCRRAPLDARGYELLCEGVEGECITKPTAPVSAIVVLVPDPATQRQTCTALDALRGDAAGRHPGLLLIELRSTCSTQRLLMSRRPALAQSGLLHSQHVSIPAPAPTMDKLQPGTVRHCYGCGWHIRRGPRKEVILPVLRRYDVAGLLCIKTGNARLRGSLFFSDLDTIFEDEFAPYISQVMSPLAENIKQNDSLGCECFANLLLPSLNDYPLQLVRSSPGSSQLATQQLRLSILKTSTPSRRH